MKPRIHLLFFQDCPNVGKARENLEKALTALGVFHPEWEEVDINSPHTYEGWRGFPSPTILINGVNMENGEKYSAGTSSCRFSGATTIETILKGLNRYGK